jgi:GT2 family glycosyltransferase
MKTSFSSRGDGMKVAACTLSYNTLGIIMDTYPRLRASFDGPLYILDNGSADGSPFFLTEEFEQEPNTAVELLETNLGYTAGCNELIRRAMVEGDADWIILINSDVIVPTGRVQMPHEELTWIDEWLRPFEDNDRAWVVGCRMMMEDIVIHAGGNHEAAWRNRYCHVVNEAGSYQITELASVAPTRFVHRIGFRDDWRVREQVPWVTFACVAIRREAFEQIGLLDERFFLYGSDCEFCLRATANGGEVWYDGLTTLEHLHEKSIEKADRAVLAAGVEDLITFYEEVESHGYAD